MINYIVVHVQDHFICYVHQFIHLFLKLIGSPTVYIQLLK